MSGTFQDLLDSKKATAAGLAILTVVVAHLAGYFHVAIDQATAEAIAGDVLKLAGLYLAAQGAADFGKHAAEAHADAAAVTVVQAAPAAGATPPVKP